MGTPEMPGVPDVTGTPDMAGALAQPITHALVGHLKTIVGDTNVLTDPSITASYAVDWTGRFQGHTPLVVRPASTNQVAEVVAALADARVSLVPQGGNTGLVGGSVPLAGEAVLSLARLKSCGKVDHLSSQATFGAGVTLAKAQAHAAKADLVVGVDLAARDSATIGGMVSTNAGGINVVRYGPMRSQVVGIEAVLADGKVIKHLGGLAKDNTGYDLAGLLTGSEGTLAVITAVRLQLRPKLTQVVTALLELPSVTAGVEVAAQLRNRLGSLYALEAVFAGAMERVCAYLDARPPVGAINGASGGGASGGSASAGGASAGAEPMWLLVEAASNTTDADALAEELADIVADLGDLITDVAVGMDSSSRQHLWSFREQIPEAVNAAGTPHKLDVTLPANRLVEFVQGVPQVVQSVDAGAQTIQFGHLGDGNVHVNVLPSQASAAAGTSTGAAAGTGTAAGTDTGTAAGTDTAAGTSASEQIDAAVLSYAAKLGGSISAEHGIGTAKKQFLHLNRTSEELATFTALKQAFDPRAVLNPNVLLTNSSPQN